jgi:hypothetical protein
MGHKKAGHLTGFFILNVHQIYRRGKVE